MVVIDVSNLGYPRAQIRALWVELLALTCRVEDTKIRRCVGSRASSPLPTMIV